MNLGEKLRKSRDALAGKLGAVFKPGIDENTLETAEEILLGSDLGWELTEEVLEELRSEYRKSSTADWREVLTKVLLRMVPDHPQTASVSSPTVIMVVGVNGAGKTTTIARLSNMYRAAGEKVLMACADTYRAAASEQLCLWGEKLDLPVFTGAPGADPGSVAFDAVRKAVSGEYTMLLVDTAGRLPTQKGLMDELSKIHRVSGKAMAGAPHRVLLVLDGTVGQNALLQAGQFMESVPVTDLAVTKLDGTARGGAVFAMARELNLPIRYIGVGEGADDLIPFEGREFIRAMTGGDPL